MSACEHNPDFECFDCETARHAFEHPEFVEGCRSCKFATIQISPAVRTTRNTNPSTAFTPKNSWEAGIATDHRGVPYLDQNLQPIGVKQFAQNRHKYESRIRELASSPNPFGAETKGA